MRTDRIIDLAKQASELEEAIHWMEEFGSKATAPDAIEIFVCFNYAFACRGVKEAAKVIEDKLSKEFGDIFSVALVDCRNTLEILKSQISEEASK